MGQELEMKVRTGEVIAFCCEHSGVRAADEAADRGLGLPADFRMVAVPCTGKVDAWHLLKAFEAGARGALVMACHDGACHSLKGNRRAASRVEYIKDKLKQSGWAPERVALVNIGPHMGAAFKEAVDGFYAELSKLE